MPSLRWSAGMIDAPVIGQIHLLIDRELRISAVLVTWPLSVHLITGSGPPLPPAYVGNGVRYARSHCCQLSYTVVGVPPNQLINFGLHNQQTPAPYHIADVTLDDPSVTLGRETHPGGSVGRTPRSRSLLSVPTAPEAWPDIQKRGPPSSCRWCGVPSHRSIGRNVRGAPATPIAFALSIVLAQKRRSSCARQDRSSMSTACS